MTCPSCGAQMRVSGDIFQCEYCKTVVAPEKNDEGITLLGEGPGEECPLCHIPLSQGSVAKTPLLFCSKCSGLLISMDLFPDLIDTLRNQQRSSNPVGSRANPDELQRHVNCPHCKRPMESHFYAGPGNVVLDYCDLCHLNWLDHGELLRIARAPDYFDEAMREDA
jgi:Zn-finger nucleic acid-binding protein